MALEFDPPATSRLVFDEPAAAPEPRPSLRAQRQELEAGLLRARQTIDPFFRGAVGGAAGLVGGAMELAPGAVGRSGAAVSRFGQGQVAQATEESPVLGFAGSMAPALLPIGRVLQAPTMAGRVKRGATVGGAFGAATPTGEEEYAERVPGKALGTALGTVLGGTIPAAISGGRSAVRGILGRTEPQVEQVAQRAEQLGFKLEPMQVRAERPGASAGFGAAAETNQALANRLVTEAAGKRAAAVTPEYIGDRLRDLGRKYDDIYLGPGGAASPRTFRVDSATVNALTPIAQLEQRLAAGAVPGVRNIATDLVAQFQAAQAQTTGGRVTAIKVPGSDLQRLRSELTRIYRTSTDNVDRGAAMSVLRELDANIARNHPDVARELATLNPQYRTVLTLEALAPARGNVSLQQLGRFLETKDPMFASGRSQHPLADLGRMGLDLGIRSIDEAATRVGAAGDVPLGRLERALGLMGRTQYGRGLQRGTNQPPAPTTTVTPTVPLLGGTSPEE